MKVVLNLVSLRVQGLKMLHRCFVLAFIFIGWLGKLLVPLDFYDQNMPVNPDKEIWVEETPLGVFTLTPGIFNWVKVLIS